MAQVVEIPGGGDQVSRLVIFDCDGVLVDSDRISLRIQAEWISALGLEATYEDSSAISSASGCPRRCRS